MKQVHFKFWTSKALILVIGLALVASLVGVGLNASAAGTGPCDIYASGGTACIAAHSTVRALYGAYSGRLYQIRRANGNTTDIGTLSAGGFANAAAQDSFCSGTTCVLTIIYDQSGHGNDLVYQGSGGAGGPDVPASATSESLTVSGNKVYSVYINPHNSFWRNGASTGVPTGSAPEGMYMVTSGTHYNSGCCFDYGNSETTRTAAGAGHMDAIYFGSSCWFGGCSGTGPWVQADLEFGLFPGGSTSWNPNQRAFNNKYVTAMLKNNGTTQFAIKGANAQSGSLTILYSGSLPSGYNPMRKEGAIILGSGGDCCATNQNDSAGTFYEGAIVAGYPSDATENSVQANIVAAGYGGGTSPTPTRTSTPAGPTPTRTNTPVAGTNFLANADMESGTTNWVVNGAGTLSSDTTQFHGGTHSVKTTGRTASWNGIGQNVAVSNFPTSGQNVTVSVWVRSQTGTPTAIATLRLTAGSTTTYVQLASAAINASGWTQLTGTVPVSWSGTLTGVLFYVETAAGTDNIYIDDASLSSGGIAGPTNTPTPTRTNSPTPTGTMTPVGPTATATPTNTPGSGPTNTPTRTTTPTATVSSGGTCSPVTSTITAPFTFDGAGTFCWQSSSLGSYINSWNTTSVTINGVNATNLYVASGSYPAKINGFWYVSYGSSVAWAHFETK